MAGDADAWRDDEKKARSTLSDSFVEVTGCAYGLRFLQKSRQLDVVGSIGDASKRALEVLPANSICGCMKVDFRLRGAAGFSSRESNRSRQSLGHRRLRVR